MRQFDVLRNADPQACSWAPYILVLQADLLDELQTVVVAPLVLTVNFSRPTRILNPVFDVGGVSLVLSVAELAGISRHVLGERVASLASEREAIVAAIDLLFTGI
ncbi:MAG: CcdB family protein [Nitrococcus sp.]|nr:CcdB family protein [Nitrococcus sp.]